MDPFKKALRYISKGDSVREAANKVGIPITTLHHHLKKTNIRSEQQQAQQFNASRKSQIIKLREKGHSYSEISERTQVNVATVKLWCSDVVLTEEQKKLNLGALTEKQKLAVEYRKQGMFITEIAKKLGCAKSSVSLWLAKHSKQSNQNLDITVSQRKSTLNMRSIHQDKKNSVIKNSMVREKLFAEKIVLHRKKGMSFNEIAELLKTTKDVVSRAFKLVDLSEKEKKDIQVKCKERIRSRLDAGEFKPMGGFRENAGASKFGYYKGIYCGSTYELCWVIYSLDHNIPFTRFKGRLEHNGVRYIPDFLMDDGVTIIEIKGFEKDDRVAKKTAVAEAHGYTVKVMRKNDLKYAFDYVEKTYHVKQKTSYTLYDEYKPKYNLVCHRCQKDFQREKLYNNKSNVVFCSSCSGKGNKKS